MIGLAVFAVIHAPTHSGATPPRLTGLTTRDRLELFAAAADGSLWHMWQTFPGGGWSGWGPMGAPSPSASLVGCPSVTLNLDGRLEIAAVASDGNLWHIWQSVPDNGWSG